MFCILIFWLSIIFKGTNNEAIERTYFRSNDRRADCIELEIVTIAAADRSWQRRKVPPALQNSDIPREYVES